MTRKHVAVSLLCAVAALAAVAVFVRGGQGTRESEPLRSPAVPIAGEREPAELEEPTADRVVSPTFEEPLEDDRVAGASNDYRRRAPRDAIPADRTRITGRVVDPNGDGVEGAEIELLLALGGAAGADEIPLRPRSTTVGKVVAEAKGRFRIEAPAYCFRLLLRATANGFLPLEVEVRTIVGGGTTDVGEIQLQAPGYVKGLVVDSAGNGVAGAEVVWMPEESSSPELAPVAAERHGGPMADSEGLFEIVALPQGRIRFAAIASGRVSTWTHPYRVLPDPREVQRELLGLGYVESSSQLVRIELLDAVRLRGRVVDSVSNAPLPARVVAMNGLPLTPWIESTADEEGRFELDSMLPGSSYQLLVTAPGYRDRLHEFQQKELEALIASGEELWVELERASDIRVHVRDGESHEPIAGAELYWVDVSLGINALWTWKAEMAYVQAVAVTDDAGDAVVPGRQDALGVWLRPQIAGYQGPHAWNKEADGAYVVDAYRGDLLHVLVVDQQGAPVEGALVELRRAGYVGGRARALPEFHMENALFPVRDRLLTDALGRATFHAPPAWARIRVTAPDFGCALTKTLLVDQEGLEHTETVALVPCASLVGLVTVPGAVARGYEVVALERVDRVSSLAFTATTDEQGRYEITDLAPGRYTVMALSPDDRRPADVHSSLSPPSRAFYDDPPPYRDVFLEAGEVRELELAARPRYGSAFGAVLRGGDPVAGAYVAAEDPPNRFFITQRDRSLPGMVTDDQGRYALRVPQGEWRLTARSIAFLGNPGSVLASLPLFVESGKDVQATILVPVPDADSE